VLYVRQSVWRLGRKQLRVRLQRGHDAQEVVVWVPAQRLLHVKVLLLLLVQQAQVLLLLLLHVQLLQEHQVVGLAPGVARKRRRRGGLGRGSGRGGQEAGV